MWIRGGGANAYPQNVDKKDVFFLTLPLSVRETLFCETTSFFDRNFFPWENLLSVTETSFCQTNYFLWHKLISDRNFLWHEHYSVTNTCFWQNSKEKFSWEVGVSVISDNQDTHFVEPCKRVRFEAFGPLNNFYVPNQRIQYSLILYQRILR